MYVCILFLSSEPNQVLDPGQEFPLHAYLPFPWFMAWIVVFHHFLHLPLQVKGCPVADILLAGFAFAAGLGGGGRGA